MLSPNLKKALFSLLLFFLSLSQGNASITTHQANAGKWLSSSQSKETAFPRYLMCGAEINYFKSTMPFSCNQQKLHNQPIRIDCIGGKTLWERANGIRFKFCNFQDWDDQKSSQYYGSYQWLGMKMCPKNQYVYGYMTRINEIDGLNGLILMCRNKFTGETSNVTVKDGKGMLIAAESKPTIENQFVYDYSIKFQTDNQYITGLSFSYTGFPEITNVEIQYDSLPAFEVKLEYQPKERLVIPNTKDQDLVQIFDVNRVIREMHHHRPKNDPKTFYYVFSNSNRKYHFQLFQKYFKPGFKLKILTPVIRSKLEEPLQIDRNVVQRMVTYNADFQFNKVFPQFIPTYDFTPYTIPSCYRLEIYTSIYSATVSNPYTLTITYTSNAQSYQEKIRGLFQSTMIGRPEVYGNNYYAIC